MADRGDRETSGIRWAGPLHEYDHARYGPLLGVSDEGSAAEIIAAAAYESAKAGALEQPGAMSLGMIIDGERITSAGEVPIGPGEYETVIRAARGRTLCTTNVGVRVNARLYQPLAEFRVRDADADEAKWLAAVFSRFKPFLKSPGGGPRPLMVRLRIDGSESLPRTRELVAKLEEGRAAGQLGPADVHRLSLLIVFDDEIRSPEQHQLIADVIDLANELSIPEVAVDGELLERARRRLSVQSLLNILEIAPLRELVRRTGPKLRLAYRYAVDVESAARTIWTGLHTARSFGLNAAKYGLVPLTLDEQESVVRVMTRWLDGWTAIPAFYVDTPLVAFNDVYDLPQCAESALLWMQKIAAAGSKVVLIDSPDRVDPRRLIRNENAPNDTGVLTLSEIADLNLKGADLGLKVLWSGGISPRQAFLLAKEGVFGIFTTSSTATPIAVGPVLANDPQLAVENEPTAIGVRRVHALIQAGFLGGALRSYPKLAAEIDARASDLLMAIESSGDVEPAVAALNDVLARAWPAHWSALSPQ